MPSNPVQNRRGFLRAFALVAGGAAAATLVGGGATSAPRGRVQRTAAPAAAATRASAMPRLNEATEQTESPVARAQRNNVRPTAIPDVRL